MSEETILSAIGPHLPASSAIIGSGDDGCVLAPSGRVVVSTDVLVESVHFRTDWSTPEDVGWRVVAQNVADAAAMNARPISMVVAVILPTGYGDEWMARCADGMAEASTALCPWGMGIDGGDLSSGPALALTGTVIGDLEGREPFLRSGARPGHLLAHCGNLGQSAAGLDALSGGASFDPSLYRRPVPPIAAAVGAPASAMMDVSDSLVRDGRRMAAASQVRINIETDLLDLAQGVSYDHALFGGEDHGFLATFAEVPPGWNVIGSVSKGSGLTVDGAQPDGTGWDHFEN